MKCEHDDCFTCPYPDCISKKGNIDNTKKRKPGRKKLPPEVKRQNRIRQSQDYYNNHKEQRKIYQHDYYAKNQEEIKQRQKEKRLSTVVHPNSRIWITDGNINKRIRASNLADYERKGWKRGRTLTPYKYKEKVKEIV